MIDYLDLAARKLTDSDHDRWAAALISAVMTGKQDSFARELATKRGCTVYTIYGLADAGKAWMQLCKHMRVAERDHFRLDVFAEAWSVIKAGNKPKKVAQFFLDVLKECPSPNMEEVKSWLRGTFHMPSRETRPETYLKRFDSMAAWADGKLLLDDRAAWNEAARVIRGMLKKYSAKVVV